MAIKGAAAKADIIEKISAALGNNWIGEFDKKYYAWGNENGEKIQVCIALSCPKTPVPVDDEGPNLMHGGIDFTKTPVAATKPEAPKEITQEEKNAVEEMLKRLGL